MGSFFIPDTSPLFRYSPCVDCTASGAWTAAYSSNSQEGVGGDQTFHIAGSSASSVAINLTASSLEIQTASGCSAFQVSLNESAAIIGCDNSLQTLPQGWHRVVLQPAGNATASLYGISGGWTQIGGQKNLANQTVDDSDRLSYTGGWEHISEDSADFGSIADYHQETLSSGLSAGAEATLTFTGAALYVYGWTGQNGSTADISIDDVLQSSINCTAPWRDSNSLLYYGAGLDSSVSHTLSIRQTSAGNLGIDYAIVSSPASNGISTAGLVCAIAGPVLTLILISVGLYIYFERRRGRQPTESRTRYPFAGFGRAKSASTGSTPIVYTINRASQVWAGKQAPSLPKTAGPGRTVERDKDGYITVTSPTIGAYTRIEQPGSGVTTRYDETILEDYLPYTGVRSSMPPASRAMTTSPHPIGTTTASSLTVSPPASSARTQLKRPPHLRQLTLPDRLGHNGSSDPVPLDSSPLSALYTAESLSTPRSALLARTLQAHQARRSSVRVFARASDFRPLTLHPNLATQPLSPPTHSPSRLRYLQPERSPTLTGLAPLPAAPGPPSAELRRGVSVKSVKTSRSFFSELFANPPALPGSHSTSPAGSAGPAPPSPLPSSRRTSEPYPLSLADNLSTARPDSSIFPLSRNGTLARSRSRGRTNTQVSPLRFSAFEPFSASYWTSPSGARRPAKDWIIELDEGESLGGSSRPASVWTEVRRGG